MKSLTKKFVASGIICILLLGSSISAYAASIIITKAFIDSNTYTSIVNVTKELQTPYAAANLTQFYKADGTPTTDYDQLYVQCGSSGNEAAPVLCVTGTIKKLTLNI